MCHLKLAALLLCSLLLASCDLLSGLTGSKGEPLDFENVERAKRLDVQEAQTVVFRTETGWEDFWNAHVDSPDGVDKPPPPQIDFDEHVVIGVFWGTRSGYTSFVDAIEGVRTKGAEVIVRVEDWSPGTICQALVQPRQVIKTEETDHPVKFRGEIPE